MQEFDKPEFDLASALVEAKILDKLVKEQLQSMDSEQQALELLQRSNVILLALSVKIQQKQDMLKKELTLLSSRKNANKQYLNKE